MKIIIVIAGLLLIISLFLIGNSQQDKAGEKANIDSIKQYLITDSQHDIADYELNKAKTSLVYVTADGAVYEYDFSLKKANRIAAGGETIDNVPPRIVYDANDTFYVFLNAKILVIENSQVTETIPIEKIVPGLDKAALEKKQQEALKGKTFSSREERLKFLGEINVQENQRVEQERTRICSAFARETRSFQAILEMNNQVNSPWEYYIATDSSGNKKAVARAECDPNLLNLAFYNANRSKFSTIRSARNTSVTDTRTDRLEKAEINDSNAQLRIIEEPYNCYNNCLKRKYTIEYKNSAVLTLDGAPYLELPASHFMLNANDEFVFRYDNKLYLINLNEK